MNKTDKEIHANWQDYVCAMTKDIEGAQVDFKQESYWRVSVKLSNGMEIGFHYTNGPRISICSQRVECKFLKTKKLETRRKDFKRFLKLAMPVYEENKAKKEKQDAQKNKIKDIEKGFVKDFPNLISSVDWRDGVYCSGKLSDLTVNHDGTELTSLNLSYIDLKTARKILKIVEASK